MHLDEYISNTIYSVLKGLQAVDVRLQNEKLGEVWTGDFKTLAHDLVSVRLAKGENPSDKKKSVPVILFDFEVKVLVTDKNQAESEAKLAVGSKFLQVLGFSGEINGSSLKDHAEKSAQNLKFTVPVSINMERK